MSAEAQAVAQSVLHLHLTAHIRHIVQIALRVGLLVVDGGRRELVAEGQCGEHGLDAARAALRFAAATPGPVYVRMGRAAVPCVYDDEAELEIGRAYVLREGSDVTIVANGVEIREALAAADALAEEDDPYRELNNS